MRAEDILSDHALEAIAGSHALRRASFFFAVDSLLEGRRLSLTALGRAQATAVAPKHTIKRIDRLLGNHRLHAEVLDYCRALAVSASGSTILIGERLERERCLHDSAIFVDSLRETGHIGDVNARSTPLRA